MKNILTILAALTLFGCSSGTSGNTPATPPESAPATLNKPVMYVIQAATGGMICEIVESGQAVTNCNQLTNTGIDMANITSIFLSPTLNKAYLSNRKENVIYLCDISIAESGQLTNCLPTGNPLDNNAFLHPTGVTINADNTQAYIANDYAESSSIAGCKVDGSTGELTQCFINPGNNPGQPQALNNSPTSVAINPITQDLFVSAFYGQPATCLAQFSNVSGCLTIELPGYTFWSTTQVIVSPNNLYVYFANYGASFVSVCALDQLTGNLRGCTDSINITESDQYGVNAIALSNNSSLAYVSNFDKETISVCNVIETTGLFSSCNKLPQSFTQPSSIAIYDRT